jgi:hypothetical protein
VPSYNTASRLPWTADCRVATAISLAYGRVACTTTLLPDSDISRGPGETGSLNSTPCRVYFTMPPGKAAYKVTRTGFTIGDYPAGRTVTLGSFFQSTAIRVAGPGVPPAYVDVPDAASDMHSIAVAPRRPSIGIPTSYRTVCLGRASSLDRVRPAWPDYTLSGPKRLRSIRCGLTNRAWLGRPRRDGKVRRSFRRRADIEQWKKRSGFSSTASSLVGQCREAGRFIPAGAGNTGTTPGEAARIAVHPRGRGEHVIAVS